MKGHLSILKLSDEQILEEVQKLRVGYALKRTMRYATERDFSVHHESVAEHVFSLIFLAQYFLPLEDPQGLLDRAKIDQILLFHDFSEIIHGDVSFHLHTPEQVQQEHKDAKEIFASLPDSIGTVGYDYWQEYEDHKTPEASFAYALDKIEPIFEIFDPVNERSIKRLKVPYETHIDKKFPPLKKYPVMTRFLEAMTKEMVARDVFWKEK